QEAIQTPVCLDESIQSLHLAKQATRLKSCQWVNIKPGRVGGLTNALAIHNWCQAADIPCWVGGMLESAVGSAFCTALAMLDNFRYPADIFPSSRFYAEDLSDPALELEIDSEGFPAVSAPQVLPEPVPKRLAAMTLEADILT
ncbi:MAG: enolase C-terminal domain-like protein, partial [Pirellulaceae bacterium]